MGQELRFRLSFALLGGPMRTAIAVLVLSIPKSKRYRLIRIVFART